MDRRVIKTKKAISRAVFRELIDTELDKITVTRVAEVADISRKTFYLHYVDVKSVVESYLQERVRELIEEYRVNGFHMESPIYRNIFERDRDFFRDITSSPNSMYFWFTARRTMEIEFDGLCRVHFGLPEDKARGHAKLVASVTACFLYDYFKGRSNMSPEEFVLFMRETIPSREAV